MGGRYTKEREILRSKAPHRCTPASKYGGEVLTQKVSSDPEATLMTNADGAVPSGKESYHLEADLMDDINEVYLFHGTSPSGARGVTDCGFKLSLAGTGAGSMYGNGIYL